MLAKASWTGARGSSWRALLLATLLVGAAPGVVCAQAVLTDADQVVTLSRGKSALVRMPGRLARVSIADPEIADAVVVSPREVLVNAKKVGTTSLLIWSDSSTTKMVTVEVTADVAALERQYKALFPGIPIGVAALGNTLILSGSTRDPGVVQRAVAIAKPTGATIINNIIAPSARQILLHVRVAEVNRSALRELGFRLFLQNATHSSALGDSAVNIETLSEGIVRLFLIGKESRLDAVITALQNRGDFHSLAEPNLMALEGQQATFLAGGEFPFPVLQGGQSNGITIVWKEFGVRLNFTPTVTNSGRIRLHVAPEVSSLDFANALTISGFTIPSLLSRRVETEVELMPGQHLAIAGLLDNSILRSLDKIPLLGDVPILGTFFRHRTQRQNRTELLVLVTPHVVEPLDTPPPIPTGEPSTWDWQRGMGMPGLPMPADTTAPAAPPPTGDARPAPGPGGKGMLP